MLLFCDIETTGLSPEDDLILEVGFMLTTDALEVTDEISMVLHMPSLECTPNDKGEPWWEPPFGVHDIVVKMHNVSGLWAEAHASNFSSRTVENTLYKWIMDHKADKLPLVGSTIGFDRGFLRIQMPRLHELFDYHSLDVSSIRLASNLWAPIHKDDYPLNEKKHRSIPDMHDTLRDLEMFKRTYFDVHA